ncbi:hypothetical protein PCL_08687 [Purpureocillium lilacinum]|uniref:Chromo domain-containing protein n=1 Tax=Purpureocillium lilacinum TaxID=33203 RepID=A0A2U3DR01_PURLI|nr:hypothetical protein PCL_08687 [Purpureocillium lilacinum]
MRDRRRSSEEDADRRVAAAIKDGMPTDPSQINAHIVHRNINEKTAQRYRKALVLWNAFEKAFPGSTPTNIQTLKQFAECVARTAKGRLHKADQGRATPASVRVEMRRFCNAWQREHNTVIPQDVKRSMAPYIEGELAKKIGLLTGKKGQKTKTFLTIENYVHMQKYYWCGDYHDYIHDGCRVDNANILNTHCFTSARRQEVCQARYQDLVLLNSWTKGKPEFKLKFTREICKATDKNQPEHPFAEQIEGPDKIPPPLFAQPLLHWLANIISSGASPELETVEQALALEPPRNGNFRLIEWDHSMLEKPVFPKWTGKGHADESRSPDSFGTDGSKWAKRAGLTTGLGLHAPRREILINCNDNGYSLGQVLRFASQHNTGVLVDHYLGNISTVDGAGTYLKMRQRTDLAEDFRSATMRWNPNLPLSLSARDREELCDSADYKVVTQRIEELNVRISEATTTDEKDHLKAQRSTESITNRVKNRINSKTGPWRQKGELPQINYEPSKEPHQQQDWRRSHFRRISHMLPPERLRLAETMVLRAPPRSPEWVCALKDLVALRRDDNSTAYQAVMRPINGHCAVPSCGRTMASIPAARRWEHVYKCHESHYKQKAGFAKFCFQCSTWVERMEEWTHHCQTHIDKDDIPFRCDLVVFRHAHSEAQDFYSTSEGQNNELKPECTEGEQKLKFKEHRGSMMGSLQALTLPSWEPSALSTADPVLLDSNMPATAVSSTPCNDHGDDESGWSVSPSGSDSSISDNERSPDQYPIECLLAMWKTQGTELFLVKWEGGSTSWEPERNVPDQSIAELKRTYRGFRDGIEILHTQVRGKALWYKILFLNFHGADEDRSWWVPEKAIDPEVRIKRETKNKRRRRKHS